MKPHANLHALSNPLLALKATPGAAVAGQDALLTDGADAGFASIMAQQLAQVATDDDLLDGGAMAHSEPALQQVPDADLAAAQPVQVEQPWQAMQPQPDDMPWLQAPVVSQPLVTNTLSQESLSASSRAVDDAALPGSKFVGDDFSIDALPTHVVPPMHRREAAATGSLQNTVAVDAGNGERPVATERLAAVPVSTAKVDASVPAAAKDQKSDRSGVILPNQPDVQQVDSTQEQAATWSPKALASEVSPSDLLRWPGDPFDSPAPVGRGNLSAIQVSQADAIASPTDVTSVNSASRNLADERALPTTDTSSPQLTARADINWTERMQPEQAPKHMPVDEPKSVAQKPSGAAPESTPLAAPSLLPGKVSLTNVVAAAMPVISPAVQATVQATGKATGASAALTLGGLLANTPLAARPAPSTVDAFSSRTVTRGSDAKPNDTLPWSAPLTAAMGKPLGESAANASVSTSVAFSTVASGAESVVRELREPAELRTGDAWHAAVNLPQVSAMPLPTLPGRHEVASMHQTVGTSAFTDELIGQVNVWVKQASQDGPMTAELHLNPADMGPVMIRIEVDGQVAQVNFAAQHADTRQAIESSLSMLSASLEEAGIQLSGSGVSDQGSSPQQAWGFDSRSDGQPRQSSQAFAMTAGQEQATLRGTPDLAGEEGWHSTPLSRSPSSASGLDLYA